MRKHALLKKDKCMNEKAPENVKKMNMFQRAPESSMKAGEEPP